MAAAISGALGHCFSRSTNSSTYRITPVPAARANQLRFLFPHPLECRISDLLVLENNALDSSGCNVSEMTGNKEAVSVIGPLLRSTDEPCPLILLGAGASFRSGVPTAADAVKQIARLVYSERELKNARPPERVKPSEWESWLQGFEWVLPGAVRLAENFPLVVE